MPRLLIYNRAKNYQRGQICSFTCVVYHPEQLYYVTTRPVIVISVGLMEY